MKSPNSGKSQKVKKGFYWIFTALLSFELVYGALWDFNILNKGYVYDTLQHLGYPLHLAEILAVAKLIAIVIVLTPKFLLPKEGAYTGVFILFVGAFVSHIFSGDTIAQYGFAIGLCCYYSFIILAAASKQAFVTCLSVYH